MVTDRIVIVQGTTDELENLIADRLRELEGSWKVASAQTTPTGSNVGRSTPGFSSIGSPIMATTIILKQA